MSKALTKNCGNCLFAVLDSYGHSNEEIVGVRFRCTRNVHPEVAPYESIDLGSDGRKDKRLAFGATCANLMIGAAVELECILQSYNYGGVTPLEKWGKYTQSPDVAQSLVDIFPMTVTTEEYLDYEMRRAQIKDMYKLI